MAVIEVVPHFTDNARASAKETGMAVERVSIHGQWSNPLAFVLAATGSAVGLGNIWKFPYITGENGGGAFVLVYLLCIAVIGVPLMMAEVMLGRRGRRSPVNTMRVLAAEERLSPHWQWLGWGGMLTGFLILSYYSVIAGWALAYVFRTGSGMFTGLTADGVQSIFSNLIDEPERLMAWHTIFMVMTMIVVARGVRGGLEAAARMFMPALFVLLLLLDGYAWRSGAFAQAVDFLFRPDFSRLSVGGVLAAMGHAFFTLSLGVGAMMVFGSYLAENTSIARTSIAVSLMDTVVALLAGLAIFPLVFANGLEPAAGPGLLFRTLPIAFGHLQGGAFFGTLFFLLLVFAAWTSAISLIEPAVAWLVENHGVSRIHAAATAGIATWLLGLLSVFSFNIWSDVKLGSWIPVFHDDTVFGLLDHLTANVLRPLGGLLIAVFAVWYMRRDSSVDELAIGDGLFYGVWRFLLRYITPVAVMIVFLGVI
jgi:NSS family neurotransmitter:Na+ symporter